MNKKLQRQIETKLDKIQALLDNFAEVHVIDPDDPETWDSDTLYNLTAELKFALALLEDKKTKQLNQHNEPIIEPGLCSLVDDWKSQKEEGENA